jgi:hypothetical protein
MNSVGLNRGKSILEGEGMFNENVQNLQMLFAAVTHLTKGLSRDISDVNAGKVSNLLSGYTDTNSIHNVNKK